MLIKILAPFFFARKDVNGILLSTGTPEWENALQEEWTKVLNRFQETNAEIFLILLL